MIEAQYVVVRYIGDPARNEPLNIGILAWHDRDYRLCLDDRAIKRVVRDHPWLARDALLSLQRSLLEQLAVPSPFKPDSLRQRLTGHSGFPVSFTEPRFTSVNDWEASSLDATVDRLVARIVRPRRRSGGSGFDPVKALAQALRPFLARHLIVSNYAFTTSRSGVPRTVDFFANSGTNVALDTLKLAIPSADEIRRRADAEAYKITDLTSVAPVQFIVFCNQSGDRDLQSANSEATRILESAGATVETELASAVQAIAGRLPLSIPDGEGAGG